MANPRDAAAEIAVATGGGLQRVTSMKNRVMAGKTRPRVLASIEGRCWRQRSDIVRSFMRGGAGVRAGQQGKKSMQNTDAQRQDPLDVRRPLIRARSGPIAFSLMVATALVLEFIAAAVLANLEPFNTPGGPSVVRSPARWIESVAEGRVTFTRPSALERVDWGGEAEQSLIAERVSGWPFPCFSYRVVHRGLLKIEGGFAIAAGELVLGPPKQHWRFPNLGRYIVPFSPEPLPLLGNVLVLCSFFMGAVLLIKGVRGFLYHRAQLRRAARGQCATCGFPVGAGIAACPECGTRMTVAGDAVGARATAPVEYAAKWQALFGPGLGLIVVGAVVYTCSPWQLKPVAAPVGTPAVLPPVPPTTGVQAPIARTWISIEPIGFRVDSQERALIRFRIEAPDLDDVLVARRSLEDWVNTFRAMPESTAVLETRLDQRLSAPYSAETPEHVHVPRGESREIEIEVLGYSVKLTKSGTLYLHLPPSRIPYQLPSTQETRTISCEELRQFDL